MNSLATHVKQLLAWRFYPTLFQWITSAALFVIVISLLAGPNNSGQNLGMALTWTLWWPLLPLSFFLTGRFWCALCPFAWLTDRLQRIVGVGLPPPRFLQRHGPWVIVAAFLAITYADETWRLTGDARRTGYLMLALLVAVVFFAAFFERRTFCRHVCFINGFAANYSRAGIVHLWADPDRCRECRTQTCCGGNAHTPGCPVFLVPASVADSGTCQLCGNCVKACPRDAIGISFCAPTSELWNVGSPRATDGVLAGIVMGVVLVEQVALLRSWVPLVEATGGLLRVDPYVWYPLVYGVLLAAFTAVPLIGLALASLLSRTSFVTFGYAIIPMALAGHLTCGAYSLLARSRTVPFAVLAIAGRFPEAAQAAWLSPSTIFAIQTALLALGAAASLYVASRLACRHVPERRWAVFVPHALLLLALLAANVYVVVRLLAERG